MINRLHQASTSRLRGATVFLWALLAACADASPRAAGPPADAARADTAAPPARAEGEGVLGVAFGVTADSIVAMRGTPAADRIAFEGVRQIGYPVVVMGQQSLVVYQVHPRDGMVRALVAAETPDVGRCTFILTLWRHGLEQKYGPSNHPDASPEAACRAFAERSAPWGVIWHRPGGRRIMLALMPGQPAVTLTYTTPEADAWERRRNGEQL